MNRHLAGFISAFIALFCTLLAVAPPVLAQSPSFNFRARSFINPFPQTDQYHLHVLGDSLGKGLAAGLTAAFENDGSVKIIDSTEPSAGLARPDRLDWAAKIDELARTQPFHIAVIMMGINDIRNVRRADAYVKWGDPEWGQAYGQQIDRLVRALKEKNIAVYWVGLPVMAESKTSAAMAMMNDVIRERVYIGGGKYIDTWNGFTDQLGAFSSYGPDLTGTTNRLREADGVSFTERGNRKLANYVEVHLRRDLSAARTERNIPLAGSEEEQSRLVPAATEQNTNAADEAAGDDADAPDLAENPGGAVVIEGAPIQAGDQPAPANNGSAAAVPNSLAAGFSSGYAPPGETVIGDLSEGVTGLATVSPIVDLNANIGERRLPVTERLYYKTLVKGEALEPKPNRADDFKWPRS